MNEKTIFLLILGAKPIPTAIDWVRLNDNNINVLIDMHPLLIDWSNYPHIRGILAKNE